MPVFRISVVNEHFSASNAHDLPSVEVARAEAIKGALQIGTSEICEGKSLFGAEVCVEHEGERLGRFIVSIGVSPLQ